MPNSDDNNRNNAKRSRVARKGLTAWQLGHGLPYICDEIAGLVDMMRAAIPYIDAVRNAQDQLKKAGVHVELDGSDMQNTGTLVAKIYKAFDWIDNVRNAFDRCFYEKTRARASRVQAKRADVAAGKDCIKHMKMAHTALVSAHEHLFDEDRTVLDEKMAQAKSQSEVASILAKRYAASVQPPTD